MTLFFTYPQVVKSHKTASFVKILNTHKNLRQLRIAPNFMAISLQITDYVYSASVTLHLRFFVGFRDGVNEAIPWRFDSSLTSTSSMLPRFIAAHDNRPTCRKDPGDTKWGPGGWNC